MTEEDLREVVEVFGILVQWQDELSTHPVVEATAHQLGASTLRRRRVSKHLG